MNPTFETSVIAFPKLYQSSDEERKSLSDVEHAARLSTAELKSRWLKYSIPPWDQSERTRLLHTACVSELSDSAFRVLFAMSSFADGTLGNAIPANDTISKITGRVDSSVRRATSELEKSGWMETSRRGPKTAKRTLGIPRSALEAIASEILEAEDRSKMSGQIENDRSKMSGVSRDCDQSEVERPPKNERSEPRPLKNERSFPDYGKKRPPKNEREILIDQKEDISLYAREPEVAEKPICTIGENLYQIFNRVYSEWGMRPGALEIQPWLKTSRSITDPNLLGYVAAHGDKPEGIVNQALFEALTYMADKRTDELQREGGGGHGKAGFGSYFAKTLRAKVTELMLAEKEAAAKAALIEEKAQLAREAEVTISGMKTKAFVDRVEINHKAALARASAPKAYGVTTPNAANGRFDDAAPKVAVVKQTWITGEQANQIIDRVPGTDARKVKEVLAEADSRPDDFFYARGAFNNGGAKKISSSMIVEWCVTRLEAIIIGMSMNGGLKC